MGEAAASYVHMVQYSIETCLAFHMSKEECMEALSKHANIDPVITSTVWKELEKENREFFESYAARQRELDRASPLEAILQRVQKTLSDLAFRGLDN